MDVVNAPRPQKEKRDDRRGRRIRRRDTSAAAIRNIRRAARLGSLKGGKEKREVGWAEEVL